MFCTDDLHPDLLAKGHINSLVKRALADGFDLWNILSTACLSPVQHYKLPVGLLQPGDPADFIIVSDLQELRILETWIDGARVSVGEHLSQRASPGSVRPVNKFHRETLTRAEIQTPANEDIVQAIRVVDGQLVTRRESCKPPTSNGYFVADPASDLLKLVNINRYEKAAKPSTAFVRGFGFHVDVALGSTVAHDCHNLLIIGSSDDAILKAGKALLESRGGLALVWSDGELILPLPIAGLMSDLDGETVAERYEQIESKAKELGAKVRAPSMMLSFLALLVIPELKLSDKGLFDGNEFKFVSQKSIQTKASR